MRVARYGFTFDGESILALDVRATETIIEALDVLVETLEQQQKAPGAENRPELRARLRDTRFVLSTLVHDRDNAESALTLAGLRRIGGAQ